MKYQSSQLALISIFFAASFACAQPDKSPQTQAAYTFNQNQLDFFESKIRPLLIKNCLECHSGKTLESELSLESREQILKGSENGKVVDLSKPDSSLLLKVIRHQGDITMPPDRKLVAEEIQAIRSWIEMKLPWPSNDRISYNAMQSRISNNQKEHWSYQPISKPRMIKISDAHIQNQIDKFILEKLREKKIEPSPVADKRTLIRRLHFDLLGIPPSYQQTQEFVNDSSPDAYEKLVDKLLASPGYGERWGRHWLDVARYSDTKGYAFARDRKYPFAWTYRDYVIASFNSDLPYDRFIVEQVAADFLDLKDDPRPLAALGFLTVGRKFNNIHDDIDDKIDVVTRGFLGLTVSCARCHDHKYDGVPTNDYYSLYGVFASSTEPADLPLIGEPTNVERYQEYQEKLKAVENKRSAFRAKLKKLISEHARENATAYLVAAISKNDEEDFAKVPQIKIKPSDLRRGVISQWQRYLVRMAQANHPTLMPWKAYINVKESDYKKSGDKIIEMMKKLPDAKINPLVRKSFIESPPKSLRDIAVIYGQLLEETYRLWKKAGANDAALKKLSLPHQQLAILLFDEKSPTIAPENKLRQLINREEREEFINLESELNKVKSEAPEGLARAMIVQEKQNPHDPVVFVRGNPGRRGDRVPRRYLELLSDKREPFKNKSGRLELAKEIASRKNPLTARVIANRIWLHHFGTPIVETPSDFGIRCDKPVHVDLLNYLAWRLLENDWSLKSLHREILLSNTYRQSSQTRSDLLQIDPENRLFSHANRRRLEFEPLRDSLLAVSENLDHRIGGKSVDIFKNENSNRRTIYSEIDRQDLPNLLRVFNFASPDQSQANRPNTTVPQQALYLLNSKFVRQQVKLITSQAQNESKNDSEKISFLYKKIFQREPNDEEVKIGTEFMNLPDSSRMKLPFVKNPSLSQLEQYVQLLLLTNEFEFVD